MGSLSSSFAITTTTGSTAGLPTSNHEVSVLHVEVVGAHALGRPAYRTGDLTRHALCKATGSSRVLRPYAVLTVGRNRCWTEPGEAAITREVKFSNASISVALDKSGVSQKSRGSNCLQSISLEVQVFHKRRIRSCRGDPLIGKASLDINLMNLLGTSKCKQLELLRRGEVRGQVEVRYSVQPAPVAQDVFVDPGRFKLVTIAEGLSRVLSGPDGLDILHRSLPREIPPQGEGEAVLGSLKNLLVSLCNQVSMLVDENDNEVLQRFSRLSQSVQEFVDSYRVPGSDTMKVAKNFMQRVFEECALKSDALSNVMPKMDEARFQRFLDSGRGYPNIKDLVPIDHHGRTFQWWLEMSTPERQRVVPRDAVIGEGAFGEVWRAIDIKSRQWYAVKQLNAGNPSEVRERIVTDHVLMYPHPCIVHLFGMYSFPQIKQSALVMEYCGAGDLYHQIKRKAKLVGAAYEPPMRSVQWIGQIFLGLEHLHLKVNTLLRDLKPCNVLITVNHHVKLTDFGLSRVGAKSSGAFTIQNAPPGSKHYAAPEVVLRKPYDCKADIYALGVLTWVLLTGGLTRCPALPPCRQMGHDGDFEALADNWKLIRQCVKDAPRHGARPLPSSAAEAFVLALTSGSTATRPDHAKIREHEFFQSLRLPAADACREAVEIWINTRSLLPAGPSGGTASIYEGEQLSNTDVFGSVASEY